MAYFPSKMDSVSEIFELFWLIMKTHAHTLPPFFFFRLEVPRLRVSLTSASVQHFLVHFIGNNSIFKALTVYNRERI